MYRSLGYIPSADSTHPQHYMEEVKPTKKNNRAARDKLLWSKSSDTLYDSGGQYQTANNNSRFHPGATSESYQHNYVGNESYHPDYFSLPYNQTATLSRKKPSTPTVPVMSGILSYKLDKIFSRWQQQTFVLTNKSLKCYERSSMSQHNPSLLWKVKLSNIENMDLTTKRGHLTIRLAVHKETHRVLLRSAQDTRVWFNMMMTCYNQSVARTLSKHYRGWGGQSQGQGQVHSVTPSRSEAIQSWLLGRPSIAKVMQSPGDCDYQHHSWVPDTKYKSKKQNKKGGGRQLKVENCKIYKQDSQDSGNSSLSTATQLSCGNVYN